MPLADPHRLHDPFWPRRLPRELVLPDTTLWFNLEVSARRYPHKPLYRFFGRDWSFGEVKSQCEALAGWLQAAGAGRGDRVLLFMQNCPQYAIAYYAILRADAVVVPANPMNRAQELSHLMSDSGARLVICSADLAGVVAEANEALAPQRRLRCVLAARYAEALPDTIAPDEAPNAAMAAWLNADPPLPAGCHRWADAIAKGLAPTPSLAMPDDLAILPYTSGTTGLPKGCMHTHRSLMASAIGGGLWGGSTAEAVSLGVVPLFHITGMMYGMHGPIHSGATVVLMPRWDRELAGRLFGLHRITHFTCVPTMLIDLLASPNMASFDLSSLRYLSGGGSAMPQAVAARLRDEFGLAFAEGYGLTETAAATHANPPERAKLQCLGMPIFGVDSRVVDPESGRELPIGEVGEIVSRGPMLFQGYWGHPEATQKAFIEIEGRRFLRTGDLGHCDGEGYFFLTDRVKRMINASGYKVWPSEVELLLFECPAVHEACIIAARDAYRGETVKAVVVLREQARATTTAETIIAWAREHMAAYKVPRQVEFVDALPKSGAGKVMWRLLQEREAQRGGD